MGIDGTHGLATPGGGETLTVGAGYVGRPEQCGEWLAVLDVDQHGECRSIGVFAQVPSGGPGQLAEAGDRAGIGHATEAKIGRLGQHAGEHDAWVIGRQMGLLMGEQIGEPGPAMYLGQQAGDAGIGDMP